MNFQLDFDTVLSVLAMVIAGYFALASLMGKRELKHSDDTATQVADILTRVAVLETQMKQLAEESNKIVVNYKAQFRGVNDKLDLILKDLHHQQVECARHFGSLLSGPPTAEE